MYLKSVLFFSSLLFCVSCTTFHYYYPSHEFKKRTYNPVKKGLIELNVYGEMSYSERPGHITSWSVAHKKGLQNVKQSIKNFCEGKYMIKAIVEKKENMGTRSDTSYHSNYSAYKDRYRSGAYGGGTVASGVGDSISTGGYRGGQYNSMNTYGGRYAGSDNTVETGDRNAHSTTRTMPVFREYTDITFQCK